MCSNVRVVMAIEPQANVNCSPMSSIQNGAPGSYVIDALFGSVHCSFAVLAAIQLDVFTLLDSSPMTADNIAASLGVRRERLELLLDALTQVKLLCRQGGLYSNSREAAHYLVRGRAGYVGDRQPVLSTQWEAMLHTAMSLKSGEPQRQHDWHAMPPDKLKIACRAAHEAALFRGRYLAEHFGDDFAACKSLLDVGAFTGGVALALADKFVHLKATALDLPNVTPITKSFVSVSRAADRVRVLTGNIADEALQDKYDVVVMVALLQVLSPDQARRALRRASEALASGGKLFIYGMVLNDDRQSPAAVIAANLYFVNCYLDGMACTEGQYRAWLRDAGLSDITRDQGSDGISVMTARKI